MNCQVCSSSEQLKYKGPTCKPCYKKQNYLANKTKVIERRMARYAENKQKEFDYQYDRKKKDPAYRATCAARNRVFKLLADSETKSSASIGCTQEEFKAHLESQFSEGMTWENYGNRKGQWNIDHTIPLSKAFADGMDAFKKACHFSNMKPMWSIENRSKGNK